MSRTAPSSIGETSLSVIASTVEAFWTWNQDNINKREEKEMSEPRQTFLNRNINIRKGKSESTKYMQTRHSPTVTCLLCTYWWRSWHLLDVLNLSIFRWSTWTSKIIPTTPGKVQLCDLWSLILSIGNDFIPSLVWPCSTSRDSRRGSHAAGF